MEIEKLENFSELTPSGHPVQFYSGQTLTELFSCETCKQRIHERDHLMVGAAHYHTHHFSCSVCSLDLSGDKPEALYNVSIF